MDGRSAALGTTTEQAVRILENWCRAQQDEEKKTATARTGTAQKRNAT
jgi:hypothetical protein